VQQQNRVILALHYCQLIPNGECGPHFVFVMAPSSGADWQIFDPNSGVFGQHTLNELFTGFSYFSPFQQKITPIQFSVTGVKTYGPGIAGGMSVLGCSPVDLLVVDPQGRRLGSLGSGGIALEIPSGNYVRDFPIADDTGGGALVGDPAGQPNAYIPVPLDGAYALTVTGIGFGPFTLRLDAVATDGTVAEASVSGTASPGSTAFYKVDYSSTASSPDGVIHVNTPPSANAGPDRTVECKGPNGTPVTLDGSASGDQDGDTLTYVWTDSQGNIVGNTAIATVLASMGIQTYTLTVTDSAGLSATAQTHVTVRDTTPPRVTASLVPVGEVEEDEGRFRVVYSCADSCDATLASAAQINGIAVTNGQIVELEVERKKQEVEFKNGLLKIEAPSFVLTVTCTDRSGNVGVGKVGPVFARERD
jgi:hypothetical protein